MRDAIALLSFLLRISRHQRHASWILAGVALAGLFGGLGNAGLIALVNGAIGQGQVVTRDALVFGGLCVGVASSRFVSQFLLARMSTQSVFHLRMRLCNQVLSSPIRSVEKVGASRILAHVTNDIGAISEAIVLIPVLLFNLAIVLGCLGYMGWLSMTMFGVVAGAMVLGTIAYRGPVAQSVRFFGDARDRWDELVLGFQGLTLGLKELKLHAARRLQFRESQVEVPAREIRKASMGGFVTLAAANSWGQILFFVVLGALLFGAPRFATLEAHVATGYALGLLFMISPLETILNSTSVLSRSRVAFQALERLSETLSESELMTATSPDVPASQSAFGEIRLDAVTHEFAGQPDEGGFALGPIDLVIRPGELVFLVGGNGSGKTTLAKILVGLYAPETGGIWLDGALVDRGSLEHYRSLFSTVFSDFYLFDRLLGLDIGELDARARAYLEELRLDHKVSVKDGALSTINLSQGQRKRLALLTAYLEDRPIYVFDEWTADQDPIFREVFYNRLLPELRSRQKAVIVITHDDRYFHLADRLVELDSGRVRRTSVLEANVMESSRVTP